MKRLCKKCLEKKTLSAENFPMLKNKDGVRFYRHSCKDCHYAGYKKWANENKDLVSKLQKNWRDGNREYQSLWHQEHKRERKDRVNARMKKEPLFKLKWQLNTLIYCSMRISGYTKKTRMFKLVGCQIEELFKHLGVEDSKGFKNKHLDHICPNDQAKTEEELVKLQHHSNLRLVPKEVNMAKGHKPTPEGIKLCRELLGREWESRKNGRR